MDKTDKIIFDIEQVEAMQEKVLELQAEKRHKAEERNRLVDRMFFGWLIAVAVVLLSSSAWCAAEYLLYGSIENNIIDNIACTLLSVSIWLNIMLIMKQKRG